MFNEIIFLCSVALIGLFNLLGLALGCEVLVGLVVAQGLIGNLFLAKEVMLFGHVVTAVDVFFVGMYLGLNLLQEFFGDHLADKAVRAFLFALVWLLAMRFIFLAYEPALSDLAHGSFVLILANTWRAVAASLGVSFLALKLERFLATTLAKMWPSNWLPLRFALTVGIAQLFDTIAFSYVALYGVVSNIYDIIVFSFVVKILTIGLSIPFLKIAVWRKLSPDLKIH